MLPTLDLAGFEALLDSRDRAEPVTIVTLTDCTKNKTMRVRGNDFRDNVFHLAERNVFIGADYESCVNRQRDRECQPINLDGSVDYFNAEQLWNGKGKKINKYVYLHTEKQMLYIAYKPRTDSENKIVNRQSVYQNADGVAYTPQEVAYIKGFMTERGEALKQGVDKQVFWNTLKLPNLKRITIGGKMYEVAIDIMEQAA